MQNRLDRLFTSGPSGRGGWPEIALRRPPKDLTGFFDFQLILRVPSLRDVLGTEAGRRETMIKRFWYLAIVVGTMLALLMAGGAGFEWH